jgi:predicted site-specific integrase-resolvase
MFLFQNLIAFQDALFMKLVEIHFQRQCNRGRSAASNQRLRNMLIGYARVSKADGSQSLDLQHDALRAAGVEQDNIYEDRASGAVMIALA